MWFHLYVGFYNASCKCISLPFYFLINILTPVYFIVRIQHIIHIAYKICVIRLFMLSLRLPVNSRLLVKLLGSQSYMWIFNCIDVQHP